MFINLSNHTSENWGEFQKKEAIKYGDIIDMPFPAISPYLSSEELDVIVNEYYEKVSKYNSPVVMLQGEFIFTFRLVTKLKNAGIKVVAGRSERVVKETVNENGTAIKRSEFNFVGFMEY